MANNLHKVFMVGWEYPPHNSGGLGVACEGITEALAGQNTQLYFTLPYAHPQVFSHMHVLNCQTGAPAADSPHPPFSVYSSIPTVSSVFSPPTPIQLHTLPQSEMEYQVSQYADKVLSAARKKTDSFEVIHAHDWMSFPAAIKVHEKTGKPFIAHVHSTEYDRIPSGHGSHYITHTEYVGMQRAQKVIAVSHFTKRVLINKYFIDEKKIEVVHNGVHPLVKRNVPVEFASGRPVIVFMGRLTAQKGAEYFLELAHSVLKKIPEALFVLAGNGDQYYSLLLQNADKKLSASVVFTGFLRNQQRESLLERADVFVMPSLAEPFGLVALEAAQRNTPVIVSHNSGVKEILPSALQADFWDIDKMSQQIVELITHPHTSEHIIQAQHRELKEATWSKAAQKIEDVYRAVL